MIVLVCSCHSYNVQYSMTFARNMLLRNVTKMSGRNILEQFVYLRVAGCSWKIRDHPIDVEKGNRQTAIILHDLQPYTTYAVYVQTYMILSAKIGGRSPILYFTTKPMRTYLLCSVFFCSKVAFAQLHF